LDEDIPNIRILKNNDIEILTTKAFVVDSFVSGVYNETSQKECTDFMKPA